MEINHNQKEKGEILEKIEINDKLHIIKLRIMKMERFIIIKR